MWQGRTAGQVKMVQQAGTPSPGTPNCRWSEAEARASEPTRQVPLSPQVS